MHWLSLPSEQVKIKATKLEFGKGTVGKEVPISRIEGTHIETPVIELVKASEDDSISTASYQELVVLQEFNNLGKTELQLCSIFAQNEIQNELGHHLADFWFDELDEALTNLLHPQCVPLVSFKLLKASEG